MAPVGINAGVVMLTALEVEYNAVRGHLTSIHEYFDSDGTRYEIGAVRGSRCRIALALVGVGNLTAATFASRAIEEFAPKALLLTGVAGGLSDDVALGDVVVATQVHAYHSGREESGGFRPRPRSWLLPHALEQYGREVVQEGSWTDLLEEDPPRVHFRPLVSGEVLLDSRTSPVAELIARHYSDAVAIDMESAGVAEAAHRKDFHRAIVIRGISDAARGDKRETDESGAQERAAAHAAAFATVLAKRIDQGSVRPSRRPPCPYRGLAEFRERDAEVFFGRAGEADDLAELAEHRRFVIVAGRSGIGKSSLLCAGLAPRLRERGFAVAVFHPLPDVPAATVLAGGLLPLLDSQLTRVDALPRRAELAEAIEQGRLNEIIDDALAETGASRLIVCVDQMDELIARSESAARDLADLLARLAIGPLPVNVLLTLRTETLDFAASHLGLGGQARRSVFLLEPMRREQLRAAIEEPVESTGVAFEPGLPERILASTEGAPAALPLMQFALTRLWEEHDAWTLSHAAYDAFDGVEGALARYAEQVWKDELDETGRDLARRLLVQMVRPDGHGEVLRRTVRGSELRPEARPVAQRLAATRLLVTGVDADGEPTYDLAHAALVTQWQRMREWLEAESDFREWQEDLRESAERAEPLRGPRLSTAVRWLREQPADITVAEREFINASRVRERRIKTAWRGAGAVIVTLLLIASTFAVLWRQRTGELTTELRQNAASLIVAESRERARTDLDTAALLAVAAYRSSRDPAVLANLAGEYLRYRSTTRLISADVGEITDTGDVAEMEVSADGRVVAVPGSRRTAILRLDRQLARPAYVNREFKEIALSPDGQVLAGLDKTGLIGLWRSDGTAVTSVAGGRMQTAADGRMRFDGTGQRLLVLSLLPGDTAQVWDLRRRTATRVPERVARAARKHPGLVWFGPDGGSLVIATDEALSLWDLTTGKPTKIAPVEKKEAAAVSGDGRTAVTCTKSSWSRWDLTSWRERRRPVSSSGKCPVSGRDYVGNALLAGSSREGFEQANDHPRRRADIVDVSTGLTAHAILPESPSDTNVPGDLAVRAVAGRIRLITRAGGFVAVSEITRENFTPINGLDPDDVNLVFSRDGRLAATSSYPPGAAIRLWDTGTGRELAHSTDTAGADLWRFSTDGRRLLAEDGEREYLEIREVPSLRRLARLPLPQAPSGPSSYDALCVAGTRSPDTVAVQFGGFLSQFNVRTGTRAGNPLHIYQNQDDLTRLASSASCANHPGRNEIAVSVGRTIELWDLGRGRKVKAFRFSDTSDVTSMRFSPDGRRLAAIGKDGTLRIWNADDQRWDGRPLQVQARKTDVPPRITDYRGGARIIVNTFEAIRVWDLERRAPTGDIVTDDSARYSGAAAGGNPFVSADGDTLLLWTRGGLTRVPLDPERWADRVCRAIGRDLSASERKALPPGSVSGQICPGPGHP